MSDKGADTLYWTDVYLKGQEEFLKRWSQFGAAQPGTAGASPFASPFNAQFASPAGWPNWAQLFGAQMPGPAADVTRHYFNLHEQYLTATRSLWDTLAKAAAQPDPAQRVGMCKGIGDAGDWRRCDQPARRSEFKQRFRAAYGREL
jgi:hypothetical protein